MEDKRGDEEAVLGRATSEEGLLSTEDREQQRSPRTLVACDEEAVSGGTASKLSAEGREQRGSPRTLVVCREARCKAGGVEDKRGDEEAVLERATRATSKEGLLSAEDREQQESPRT